MTTLREAATHALKALEGGADSWQLVGPAIDALKAALAEPTTEDSSEVEPVQEPVAWRWGYRSVTTGEMDWRGYVEIAAHPNLRSPEIIMEPLYASLPQSKPLTEEEIQELSQQHKFDSRIERAHGIK